MPLSAPGWALETGPRCHSLYRPERCISVGQMVLDSWESFSWYGLKVPLTSERPSLYRVPGGDLIRVLKFSDTQLSSNIATGRLELARPVPATTVGPAAALRGLLVGHHQT